jgi:hypothetical protein
VGRLRVAVGRLAVLTRALAFDAMDHPAEPGLTLTAYTAEPGSPSEDALTLLASWATTSDTDRTETDQHAH